VLRVQKPDTSTIYEQIERYIPAIAVVKFYGISLMAAQNCILCRVSTNQDEQLTRSGADKIAVAESAKKSQLPTAANGKNCNKFL